MASFGRVDCTQFEEFLKKAESKLNGADFDKFIEGCAKELAARLLTKAIKRTPVGQYPKSAGKLGGTLRRGWTGGVDQNVAGFVSTLDVVSKGSMISIEIINPVEYASYVEFGHRTRNHKGWVEGQFILTKSEDEIRQLAPGVLEKKLQRFLKGIFG